MTENVFQFPKINMVDVPAALRTVADEIEARGVTHKTVVIVLSGPDEEYPMVSGFGEEAAPKDALHQLVMAQAYLTSNIVRRS